MTRCKNKVQRRERSYNIVHQQLCYWDQPESSCDLTCIQSLHLSKEPIFRHIVQSGKQENVTITAEFGLSGDPGMLTA
jgi:hypothetical protein